MKRIFQTIIASTALLFCVQGAQAATMPIAHDFSNSSFLELGQFDPDPNAVPGTAPPTSPGTHPDGELLPSGIKSGDEQVTQSGDSYYVTWFGFSLASAASVTLDTLGSFEVEEDSNFDFVSTGVELDTILALYFGDVGNGALVDGRQNDDCGILVTSCLTFGNLAAGEYIAGVSTSGSGHFFVGDWMMDRDNNDNLLGLTKLNISVAAPSAVPVPAAVWLFGTALIGFVGMSRRTSVKS
jgi:hypothetical protein